MKDILQQNQYAKITKKYCCKKIVNTNNIIQEHSNVKKDKSTSEFTHYEGIAYNKSHKPMKINK